MFGENYLQEHTKLYPKSTQAVIRGLPNAIGIPTKNNPGCATDSYLTDDQLEEFKASTLKALRRAVKMKKTIVIPADGIGTGAAQLSQRAPMCATFLSGALSAIWCAREN